MKAMPTIIQAILEVLIEGRIARRMEDLDEDTLNAIAAAKVPAQYG